MARLFIIIILIFAAAVIGVFYLRPQWQQFQTLRKESENLRNIAIELDDLIQNRDALLKAINTVSRQDLQKIDQALPQGPRSAEFLVLLETLANRNNIVLRQVDFIGASEPQSGQPRPGGAITAPSTSTVKEFPISMNVSGSYEAFKSFLRDLERSLRIIDISSISFSSSGKDQFEFSIRGKTYYQ